MGLLDGLFETVVSVACLPVSVVLDVTDFEGNEPLTGKNIQAVSDSLKKIGL